MTLREYWNCYYGIARHQVERILRIWPQTFIPSMVNTLLYFIVFGMVLGRRVGMMGGVTYMTYIAPGLILSAVILNAYSNVVSIVYTNRWLHIIDELIASPTPRVIMLLGFLTGGVFRAMIIAVTMTVVALFFIHGHGMHIGMAILAAMLCALMFSAAGFINGLYARNFDDTSIVPTFILVPLTYLGGIFYDVHKLPHVWYIITLFNPVHYLIEMFRYALVGVAPAGYHPWWPVLVVFCFCALLFAAAYYLLLKGRGIRT